MGKKNERGPEYRSQDRVKQRKKDFANKKRVIGDRGKARVNCIEEQWARKTNMKKGEKKIRGGKILTRGR